MVTAYYEAGFDITEVVESVVSVFSLPTKPRFSVNSVPDQDWIKTVQQVTFALCMPPFPATPSMGRELIALLFSKPQSWPPCRIGNLLLRFPW